MAKAPVEDAGKALGDLIRTARKKPLNFAMLLAKESVVLEAHPIKGPDVMRRQAKAKGGSAKGTQGVMSVSGKLVELTCEDADFPRSLAKTAKRHFASLGVPAKIVMILPGGETIDADDEDEAQDDADAMTGTGADTGVDDPPEPPAPDRDPDPDAPATDAPETAAPPGDDNGRAALVARLKQAAAALRGFGPDQAVRAQKIATALKTARTEIDGGNLDRAGLILGAVERSLDAPATDTAGGGTEPADDAPAPPPPDTEARRAKLRQAFAAHDDDLKRLLNKALPEVTGKARKIVTAFEAEVAGDNLDKAEQLLRAFEKYLADELKKLPAPPLFESVPGPGATPDPMRYAMAVPLGRKYPAGAQATREVMDGFAATIGDLDVTDDVLRTAAEDVERLKQAQADAQKRLDDAGKMPDGPKKIEAFTLAQVDLRTAGEDIGRAEAFLKAARGKKLLTEALSFGPLSADSGQKLSDRAAAALIEGFARDPDLADTAVKAAAGAKHPEALALGLGAVIDARQTGFAAADGTRFADDDTAAKYGADLLKMGANVGTDFFDRMPAYLNSGRQHVTDPLGDLTAPNVTAAAQTRSTAVAGALIGPDGQIDTRSDAARDTIGDLLFSPFSLRKPMPAMNEHLLGTVEFLSQPANAARADEVLGGIPDQPGMGASKLVRRALGKGPTAPVGKADAQQATLASMLKPLDQGPVGSCFSTAPARRMRETDPLAAMQAYADIAGTGKYKPAFGPEVPAVQNTPPDEDPIMRSWEYSLATSTARTARSDRVDRFGKVMDGGVAQLASGLTDIMVDRARAKGGIKGLVLAGKEKAAGLLLPGKLKKAIADAFEFTYDPNSTITDSNDGSSSTGRYILTRKGTGAEVRSQADFEAQIADVAIGLLGLDDPGPEADQVRAQVSDQAFIDAVTPVTGQKNGNDVHYLPWEQTSGGQTTAATQTLFGKDMKQAPILTAGADTGDRAADLLTDMMTAFADSPEQMITIRTVGMHGFNALPNDPSLDKLKAGGKAKFAENVETHLKQPGEALRDTDLSAERAGWLFDQGAEAWLASAIKDADFRKDLRAAIAAHRPTTGGKPADIDNAFRPAAQAAAALTSDAAKFEPIIYKGLSGKAKGAMLREMGAPEFTVADTNWGSAEDHTFFVVAPDPTTGEPALWKKTVPPGTLSPTTDDWIEAEWAAIR